MSFQVEYDKSVEDDVKEILDWYSERSLTASINFLSQMKIAERILQQNPFSYRKVSAKDIRRIVIKKFPYKMYFRVDNSIIYILAVIHFSRSSRYIRQRLKK